MFSKNKKKGGTQTGPYISRKKKLEDCLQKELKQMEKEGIHLRMNGQLSSPKEIAMAHRVAEEGCYMRDYIPNQKGGIEEVDFWYIES